MHPPLYRLSPTRMPQSEGLAPKLLLLSRNPVQLLSFLVRPPNLGLEVSRDPLLLPYFVYEFLARLFECGNGIERKFVVLSDVVGRARDDPGTKRLIDSEEFFGIGSRHGNKVRLKVLGVGYEQVRGNSGG